MTAERSAAHSSGYRLQRGADVCAYLVNKQRGACPHRRDLRRHPEQAIRNMGRVSNPGMAETDRTILGIMMERTRAACKQRGGRRHGD